MHRLYQLAGTILLVAGAALAFAGDKPPAPASVTKAHPLDLSVPPINHVLTPQQVQSLTAEHDDATPTEDVTVQRPIYEAPVPVGTFRALPWALTHPLEAWKIFAPITDD